MLPSKLNRQNTQKSNEFVSVGDHSKRVCRGHGKGGERIKRIRDESGAKIQIDKSSTYENDEQIIKHQRDT